MTVREDFWVTGDMRRCQGFVRSCTKEINRSGHELAIAFDLARGRGFEPGYKVKESAFAAAARSEKDNEFISGYVHIYISQRHQYALGTRCPDLADVNARNC